MRCITITKKTQKLWIWKTIDHRSKKLIGWALGRRDIQTLIKMYDSMEFKEFSHIYSDCYECYKEFVHENNLTQFKKIHFDNRTK